MAGMVKLFSPYLPQTIIPEIKKVFDSGCITQGKTVEQFERDFAKLFNVSYPVSMNSCTSALETAYELLNLKPGDEVISTPLTCTATNIPLLRRGVKIVWADILEDTLCIDPVSVRDKLTANTKAVVQVHLGGVRADVGKIFLPVVSDAAQALGIFTGDMTCCSFQAIKHITTADGGMLVVDRETYYRKAKLLRWFGIDRDQPVENGWESYKNRMMSFEPECLGSKRHMNDMQAAMGIAGLRHYTVQLRHREHLFDTYWSRLNGMAGLSIIEGKDSVHWLMTVLVERRDDFAKMLFEKGIETNVVQIRNDAYKIFGGRAELPVMDAVEDKYISLPIGMHVATDDVEYICDQIERGW